MFKSFKVTLMLLFILGCSSLFALGFSAEPYGYRVDVPEGWGQVKKKGVERLTFMSPDGAAAFQILSYPGSSYSSAADMAADLQKSVGAKGDLLEFDFEGRGAVFADLKYIAGESRVRGFFVFIEGKSYDFSLMAYTTEERYEEYRYFLLSALDSFSLEAAEGYRPGPVSSFYLSTFPQKSRSLELKLGKGSYKMELKSGELETLRTLIEREVKVLIAYGNSPHRLRAWQRYYRTIYRDSYSRLSPLAAQLEELSRADKGLFIRELVSWVQRFKFSRTWGNSDLVSPLETLFTATGDCDSRALLTLIILHHFDVDAVFLISERFKHAAIGINYNFKGAAISYQGKSYTYVELNTEVAPGQIARDFADPSGWMVFELRGQD